MHEVIKKNHLILLLLIISIFGLYISTTPASVFHGDTGETITASLTLGIQHPPGYPAFSLLGKIFSFIPLGDISYRIYLLSIFLSLMCFAALFFLSSELAAIIFRKNVPMLFLYMPSLFFATGFYIWEQSIIAKGGLYLLNILFTISITILLIRTYRSENNRQKLFFLFFFLYGLSMTNHHMSQAAVFPAYFFLLYKSRFLKTINPKNVILYAVLFIIGFSVYMYLPIRSGTALLNWGEPDTLEKFLKVFSRRQYLNSEGTRSLINSLSQAGKFFSSLSYNFMYAGLFFAVFGGMYLYKREKNIFIYLVSIPALFLVIISLYLNLPKERLYIMETYITVIYFPVSILAGLGIHYLIRNRAAQVIILAIIMVINIAVFFPKLDKSRYFFAYDYNRNILDSLELNSIIFITGDGIVFPSWYLKYAKKYRPDITLIGSAVLPMKWVRDDIRRQNPSVAIPKITRKKIGTESTGYIINALIKMNMAKFPIYFSYNKPEENALTEDLKIMPKGLVQRVLFKDYAVVTESFIKSNENLWKYYNKRGMLGTYEGIIDKKSEELYIKDYAIIANTTGTFFEDRLYNSEALSYFKLAHKIRPNDHEYYYNMGNGYYNLKQYSEAVDMYRKCLAIDDSYENAWFNLGVANYTIKDYKRSLESFRKVKEINPTREKIDSYISMLEKFVAVDSR